MKLIITHLPTEACMAARTELADLGILRLTMCEVHSTSTLPAVTLHYRGAPVTTHLRAEVRLECVAGEGQAPAIVHALRKHAGRSGEVAVIEIEQLHQPSSDEELFQADPRQDPVLR
jgi:nitrogen regulatory protein PII